MSRQTIARLLLALVLLTSLAACGKSPTGPDNSSKPNDTLPWNLR